jgi:uncharacterized protein
MSRFPKNRSKAGKKQTHSRISKKRALELLKESGCEKRVVEHCKAVSRQALKIARRIKKTGRNVDVDFIETAGLLHDIGRSVTHGICHGIEGGRMLKDYPRYARACRRHIGAGIDRTEAGKLGLPAGIYTPKTLEEKIIAHADNTIEGSKTVPIEKTIKAYDEKLGKKHPATRRLARLADYIKKLTGD